LYTFEFVIFSVVCELFAVGETCSGHISEFGGVPSRASFNSRRGPTIVLNRHAEIRQRTIPTRTMLPPAKALIIFATEAVHPG
jgi:hypothetical protein